MHFVSLQWFWLCLPIGAALILHPLICNNILVQRLDVMRSIQCRSSSLIGGTVQVRIAAFDRGKGHAEVVFTHCWSNVEWRFFIGCHLLYQLVFLILISWAAPQWVNQQYCTYNYSEKVEGASGVSYCIIQRLNPVPLSLIPTVMNEEVVRNQPASTREEQLHWPINILTATSFMLGKVVINPLNQQMFSLQRSFIRTLLRVF